MAKFCSNCGSEIAEGAGFCGSCGTAVAAESGAPAPYAPPPAPSVAPTAPVDLAAVVRTATGGGIRGPLKIAATMLATSFLLSVAVGLLEMVKAPHVHWTFTAVITAMGSVWASIFGADLGIKASIHGGPFTFSGSGGLSAVPLTLTTLTLGAGIIAFKRVTAGRTSLLSTGLTATSAALVTVIPLLVMTLVVGMNTHDIEKLAGLTDCTSSSVFPSSGSSFDSNGNFVPPSSTSTDSGACINDSIAQAVTSGSNLNIGPSSTQVFFFGFVLILVVLMAATLARRELYAGRYTVWVRNLLRAPVSGFGWLLVGLIPAGWMYFAFVYSMLPSTAGAETSQLHVHGWVNLLTAVFSAGANLGFVALGLGAWGKYGGSVSAAGHSEGRHFGLNYIAGDHSGGSDPGFWAAAGLAPLVLAFAVFMVVRGVRKDGAAAVRWDVGAWILSMLIAFPLLDWMSSVGVHGSAAMFSGHANSGFNVWATFTVFAYALLIGLAALALTGNLRGASLPNLSRLMAGSAAATPAIYNVGDVVNGHRFTGTEWVPVDTPPTAD